MSIKLKPLVWSEHQASNPDIRYDHVIAETPFGRFLITWKSWKDDPAPVVDETPWGEGIYEAYTIEEAKQMAEDAWKVRILECMAFN